MNKEIYYVGMDIHKRNIAICCKQADGTVIEECNISATKPELRDWVDQQSHPLLVGIEATLFSPWVYDMLAPRTQEIKVANTMRLAGLSKNKNDQIDARTLSDLLRVDLFPESYMHPREIREMRNLMRFRNYIVRILVRFKNKLTGQLMERGIPYDSKKIHQKKYFKAFMGSLEDVPESVMGMLRIDREMIETLDLFQRRITARLQENPELKERIRILRSIPAVGEILALVWALEIGDVNRFSNSRKIISYCGLCSAQNSSGGKNYRDPVSKQRNKHLQWALIEVAKIAPRYNPKLAEVHARAVERGHKNRATMCVARKLATYLFSVDKNQKEFELYPEKAKAGRRTL